MGDDILAYSSEKKGIVTANTTSYDVSSEITSLRPTSFKDYI